MRTWSLAIILVTLLCVAGVVYFTVSYSEQKPDVPHDPEFRLTLLLK